MSAPLIEYGHVEGAEHPRNYIPGGYHPVRIDERIKQRYRIVHKLGHGTFSTIWLAIDEETSQYVAIKIGTADAPRNEVDILSQLTQSLSGCKSKLSLIPAVLNRFDIQGPNGTHPCFVTHPARCSVRDANEATWTPLFHLNVARSLAAQLTIALSLVHARGYAHGDLHLGNLLLQLPSDLNFLSVEQLYERHGRPDKEPVIRLDTKEAMPDAADSSLPPYLVPPVWLGVPSPEITLSDAKLILTDFGVAFRPSEQSRFESYTPIELRPPEAFFEPTTPLTLKSDIWSLGCVIFQLLAHRSLINASFLAPQDHITAQQVQLQGVMPHEWWSRWEERAKWFDVEGRALGPPRDVWNWQRRVEEWIQPLRLESGMETMSIDESIALVRMLKWMTAWRPEERPSGDEVLRAKWMVEWALPAYQQGQETVGTGQEADMSIL